MLSNLSKYLFVNSFKKNRETSLFYSILEGLEKT